MADVPRVYIETSVWSMAQPGRDRTMREATLQFLAECEAGLFQPHLSDLVLIELGRSEPRIWRLIAPHLMRVKPVELALTDDAKHLSQQFVEAGVLGPKRVDDARHVACAVVHGLDVLVSWNFRHIANHRKAAAFRDVAGQAGFDPRLEIHTPMEVLHA